MTAFSSVHGYCGGVGDETSVSDGGVKAGEVPASCGAALDGGLGAGEQAASASKTQTNAAKIANL